MASYGNGFQYVNGTFKATWSTVSSTATFKGGNPVQLGLGRTLTEADSQATMIYGIALHDAANSITPGRCLVQIIYPDTVFASKVATNIAGSALSIGQSMDLTKSGDYVRPANSRVTPAVIIVPREDGSTIDSTDSSIWVQFLGVKLGPFASSASTLF